MLDRLAAIAERYRIADAYVFGSRAAEIAARLRGEPAASDHPASDVDFGVRPLPGSRLGAHDRVRLTLELEGLLGVDRVDLVILPEADPILAADIVGGELLYALDAYEEAENQLYVLRRAGDLLPFARERWAHFLDPEVATWPKS